MPKPATFLVCLAAMAGCSQGGLTGPVDAEQEGLQLPLSLEPGKTKKEDVLLAFGPPSAKFEGERILSYRLRRSGDKLIIVPPIQDPGEPAYSTWANADHNLMLVFDGEQVLRRSSLLRMR